MSKTKKNTTVIDNRKAYYEYFIQEKMEAGIELAGTEVKSIRAGKANLADAYVAVENNELWIIGMHISPYDQGNRFNKDSLRKRKLLMHRTEINRLDAVVRQQGLTLIPTRLYFKHGRVKVEVGLAKGKRQYDKRDAIASRDAQRDIERQLKSQRND